MTTREKQKSQKKVAKKSRDFQKSRKKVAKKSRDFQKVAKKKSRNCENEGAIVNGPYRAPYSYDHRSYEHNLGNCV